MGGKIESVAPCQQPNWPEELLPDNDEELVAFMAQFPPLPAGLPTVEEMEKQAVEHARIETETKALGDAILRFLSQWANLENTCSRLFYDVVHCSPQESHVAYAIYHALGGFESHLTVLGAALEQLIVENTDLEVLKEPWRKVLDALRKIKVTRNSVAHGSISTILHNNQRYVRLTAPWFDVKKNAGQLRNHNIPGIDGKALEERLIYLNGVASAVGLLDRAIEQYRKYGDGVLPQAVLDINSALGLLKRPD
ncbi:hypothetical protein AB4Y43_18325 [Paraburkholderia sp. BR10872]|uniref:hypothetical protein n=1 Tax=Paraburkholderia sp. BR10872 TaxID=3236989 RepID=UPI0034D162DB